jgi:hypothetical protein
MSRRHRLHASLAGLSLAAVLNAQVAAQDRLPTTRETPRSFGVGDYTVTVVSAVNFFPQFNSNYGTSPTFGRYADTSSVIEYYAGLDLPGGAVIDYIGLNSTTDTPFALGVAVYSRQRNGAITAVGAFSSTVHDWDTDFNAGALGYTWDGQSGRELVINVEQASVPTFQFFGWVEIWWRRQVSPAPGSATFNDVPTFHPFFQYVEALAASGITGGCGNGNFCPDAPVTRGQMAVFLSKALGLHWPGATAPPAAHQ